jgi:hypothetical protein
MADTPEATETEAKTEREVTPDRPRRPEGRPEELRVKLHSLPKVVFFYPTWIASLVCALVGLGGTGPDWLGSVWMGLFVLNLFVIAWDFTEERTLIALLGGLCLALGFVLLGVAGQVVSLLGELKPMMNGDFYWAMFGCFSIVFVIAWLGSLLDYWIIEPNEVIHRYGLFRKMKRFSTESLRWDKVIPDVMERIMLGTGQIILTTPHEKHPIIIDHVLRIGSIDDRIARVLGVKQVIAHRPMDRGDEEY